MVNELIYSPSSLAVDEGKGHRLYWADPKYKKVDSCLPDGSQRAVIVNDKHTPWAIDVFENHLYWVSKDTHNLYVQDKFGRGRIYVLASAIVDPHCLRVYQRFARDMLRAESACNKAPCTHLCAELPRKGYRCMCPENVTQLNVILCYKI